jgi:nitrate reductase NapE component
MDRPRRPPPGEFEPGVALKPPVHPDLKAAADSCRLLGGLFIALGILPMLAVLRFVGAFGVEWMGRVLAIATTLVLVAPGAWYVVAARLIRRADARAARISMIVAVFQAAVIVGGLAFGVIFAPRTPIAVPAFLAVFFLPAVLAMLYHLARARRAAEITATSHAFEAIAPRPVLPVDAAAPGAAPADR